MAVITTEDQKKEIVSVQKNITAVINKSTGLKIKTQADLDNALALQKNISEAKKVYKEKIEDSIVKPIKDGLKALQAFVDPIKKNLENAEMLVKREILAYKQVQDAKAAEKAKVIEAKVESGEMKFGTAAKKIEKMEAKTEAIPTRKVKEIQIINKQMIPGKYWIVDEVAVRKDALAGIEVPGVLVVEREIIVNR